MCHLELVKLVTGLGCDFESNQSLLPSALLLLLHGLPLIWCDTNKDKGESLQGLQQSLEALTQSCSNIKHTEHMQ